MGPGGQRHRPRGGIRLLAETTGIFTETAGGVTVAGAMALVRDGKLTADDELVLCITGNGLKTIEAVKDDLAEAPVIQARVKGGRRAGGKVEVIRSRRFARAVALAGTRLHS